MELKIPIALLENSKESLRSRINQAKYNTQKRNKQEMNDTINKPRLRIMDIDEGEQTQVYSIDQIMNKVINKTFLN